MNWKFYNKYLRAFCHRYYHYRQKTDATLNLDDFLIKINKCNNKTLLKKLKNKLLIEKKPILIEFQQCLKDYSFNGIRDKKITFEFRNINEREQEEDSDSRIIEYYFDSITKRVVKKPKMKVIKVFDWGDDGFSDEIYGYTPFDEECDDYSMCKLVKIYEDEEAGRKFDDDLFCGRIKRRNRYTPLFYMYRKWFYGISEIKGFAGDLGMLKKDYKYSNRTINIINANAKLAAEVIEGRLQCIDKAVSLIDKKLGIS